MKDEIKKIIYFRVQKFIYIKSKDTCHNTKTTITSYLIIKNCKYSIAKKKKLQI